MTTNAMVDSPAARTHNARSATAFLVPLGRLFFVAIFAMAVPGNFKAQTVEYARHAGVPLAEVAVPVAGVIAGLGALSILFGYRARIGAWLIVLFLVPVTLVMHRFWGVADPQVAMVQRIMFMKNLSMLGAALMLTHFGAGPFSVDARR